MIHISAMPMRLVGDRLEVVPAQSAFGHLARLSRLNQLKPRDYRSFFGLSARKDEDLHHVLATVPSRRMRLAEALKIDLPVTWDPAIWKPYREHQVMTAGATPFRYCLACIRVGYHCNVHQLLWMDCCPWHHVRLRTRCPRCNGPLATSTGAGRKLLTCSCSFDPLNESAAARLSRPFNDAEQYIDSYLSWTESSRDCQILIGVPGEVPSASALKQLVRLPATLMRSVRSQLEPQRIYRHGLPKDQLNVTQDVLRMKTLRDPIPRMLHLPEFMASTLVAVAREVARSLPAGSLSCREQVLFLGKSSAITGDELSGRELSAVVSSLPPLSVGDRYFLNLQSVHPMCTRFLVNLEDAFSLATPGLALIQEHPALRVLRIAQREVLSRLYAEGLRAILAKHVPEVYAKQKRKLQLSTPLALARLDNAPSLRLAFTPMASYEDPSDLLVASTVSRRSRRRGN